MPSTPAQAADDEYISYPVASPHRRTWPRLRRSAPVARGSCSLAAPSLTAGITASRVSSRDLAMGPVSGPRSSRGAGRHVTAQRWRKQAACQRSPRASARLAGPPHEPARGAVTRPTAVPRAPPRRVPIDGLQRRWRRLPQACLGGPPAGSGRRRAACHTAGGPLSARDVRPRGAILRRTSPPRGAPSEFQPLAGRPSENRTPQEGCGGGVSRHAPRQNHRPGGQGRVVAPVARSLP